MSKKEEVHGLYDHVYKGSMKIDISSYFKDYQKLIRNSEFYTDDECDPQSISKFVSTSKIKKEDFDRLAEHCSIDNLTVPGEMQKVTKESFEWFKDLADPSVLDGVELQTVNQTKNRSVLKGHQKVMKYRSEKPIKYKVEESEGPFIQPDDEILVSVRVYVPFTSKSRQTSGALGKLSVNYVIGILGSQTLDQLRDKINCISDLSISKDISDAPVRKIVPMAKDVYKSGFFFIEDTFYNDFRDPNNKDNSKVIRDWAETRNLGPFKTATMERTRIDSLSVRFGFPWVYQHQGDCEHLIVFSDARLVHVSDELALSVYPRIIRIKPRPNRYCMTCGVYNIHWITTNNTRLPHDPCFFCDSCFESYNYIDGRKIGFFKAYAYPYDCTLMPPHMEAREDNASTSETIESMPIKQEPKAPKKMKHVDKQMMEYGDEFSDETMDNDEYYENVDVYMETEMKHVPECDSFGNEENNEVTS